MGRTSLIISAVPFLPGAKGRVVPCGKVITQFFSSALTIFRVSDGSSPLLTSFPSARHVLLTVIPPASKKRRESKLSFIVSTAAT